MNRPLIKKKAAKQPQKSAAVLLLGTIADTTWRMFVPTIGLTLAGVFGDRSFNTSPILTIAGIVSGVVVALLLVLRQLSKVGRSDG